VAPKPHLSRQRQALDSETFNALFTNRMHVLRDYGKRVVRPVCRELARREPPGSLPASAPKLLVRHPMLLADEARGALKDLLQRYDVLRAVFDFRERLQQVWNDTNQARALAQLRELCSQAESSGIRALGEFARRLRAYAQAPPSASAERSSA
jgi:stearoyl-CoA desaturase (delta-9 desaturase)